VTLPDWDVSLAGFGPSAPVAYASFSTEAISALNPVDFEWTAYPGATAYWVDLSRGEELDPLWQSGLVGELTVDFDGQLADGTRIAPGEYWWGVGARRTIGSYTLTVYGYQQRFSVKP
jgi:hypothetical protein